MSEVDDNPALFGQITLEAMQQNELLTRTVLPLVKRAIEHSDGRYSLDNVIDGLRRGEMELWGAMKPPAHLQAVAVTHVETYPSGTRVFKILHLGGPSMADVAAFFRFIPRMEALARQAQCAKLVMIGRKGWERDLAPPWKTVAAVYERGLSPA